MRAPVGRQIGDVGVEQADRSRIWPEVAADLIEQRCLAGSVRTDDQATFAGAHREGNVLGHSQPAEGFLQIGDFQRIFGWRGHRGAPRPVISLLKPGTMPAGITRTMNRNTSPSSMFQRSI